MFRKNQNHLWGFQSTLPARGATAPEMSPFAPVCISIHAPRTGSDRTLYRYLMLSYIISIHAPRTGSDCQPFQTPPTHQRISIHAPRTGSDVVVDAFKPSRFLISIHAPRTGSDKARAQMVLEGYKFQSTLPARGATIRADMVFYPDGNFNPRSPHGERHHGRRFFLPDGRNFNPRSPHGERRAYREDG